MRNAQASAMRSKVAILGALAGLAGYLPQAAADRTEALTEGWFTVEAIVFQRTGVTQAESAEQLVRIEERSVPADIRSVDAVAEPNAYDLGPLARATLDFPTLSFHCAPDAPPQRPAAVTAWYQPALPHAAAQSALPGPQAPPATPAEPPPEVTAISAEPVPDDAPHRACRPAGPALESGVGGPVETGGPHDSGPGHGAGDACPPAPFDIPVAPGNSTALCGPQWGQQPPHTEPALEPHPLLDWLSAAHRFQRGLLDRSYQAGTSASILGRDASRIRRTEGLRLLWHGRWMQPVPQRGAPQALLVQAGRRTAGVPELEGTFSITLGRYLHFHARLWQAGPPAARTVRAGNPTPVTDGPQTPAESHPSPDRVPHMVLEESRVMRSGTLHYLDHPVLGVLVRADPVPAPRWLVDASAALEAAEAGD